MKTLIAPIDIKRDNSLTPQCAPANSVCNDGCTLTDCSFDDPCSVTVCACDDNCSCAQFC